MGSLQFSHILCGNRIVGASNALYVCQEKKKIIIFCPRHKLTIDQSLVFYFGRFSLCAKQNYVLAHYNVSTDQTRHSTFDCASFHSPIPSITICSCADNAIVYKTISDSITIMIVEGQMYTIFNRTQFQFNLWHRQSVVLKFCLPSKWRHSNASKLFRRHFFSISPYFVFQIDSTARTAPNISKWNTRHP